MHPKPRRGLGEALGSLICFIVILGALVAIDDRVRDRVSFELSPNHVADWGDRTVTIISVILDVARDQSIEHAPLLIFSVVAFVLVVFMLRT